MKTPADLGIEAAKQDAQEQIFTANLIEEFKTFVTEEMSLGLHERFNDHYDFLKDCLFRFELKNNEEGG